MSAKKARLKKTTLRIRKSDLWIAPKFSLKRNDAGDSGWADRDGTRSSRLLELADIALGLRKPQAFRKRRSDLLHAGKQSN